MNDRERLVELLKAPIHPRIYADPAKVVAEYLIDNGVTFERHGRWVKRYLDGEDMSGKPCEIMYACNCSECGLNGNAPTNYCPNCGAKMDGEE